MQIQQLCLLCANLCQVWVDLLVANDVAELPFPIVGTPFPAVSFIWLLAFMKIVEMLHIEGPCSAARLG